MNTDSAAIPLQAARPASIWPRLVTWVRRSARSTRLKRLEDLSDAALHDLGLARCEISSVEAEAAGRTAATRLRVLYAGAGAWGAP